MWLVPVLLLVPNIMLDCTELLYTPLERVINICLPAGLYLLLMSLWRRNGITALALIPIAVLCAFQIVLLFLYGESIIAIDMFLNVLTTNVEEASELLRNLSTAICVVCLVYLPMVVLSIVAVCRHDTLPDSMRRYGLISSTAFLAVGVICAVAAWGYGMADGNAYRPQRTLFPVNVISNMFGAGERTVLTENYNATSDSFDYHCTSRCTDTTAVVVLVIGETGRADNWELGGYPRHTNPRLAHRKGLVYYPHALSESNTTHKSVPLMLTHLGAEQFADSMYTSRSVIDAFAQAGFDTYWISNQSRNHSLIDACGERAAHHAFIRDDGENHYDTDLVPYMAEALRNSQGNTLIVLHTYGSHFNYHERYPEGFEPFGSNSDTEASAENRAALVNEYDNAIAYTDLTLDSIIGSVAATARPAAVLYMADHGEDIYDDARGRFLHASPTPTYWQLHVPVALWMSDSYVAAHPDKYACAARNIDRNVAPSRAAFHTLISIADLDTPYYHKEEALTEPDYREPERYFLNDYNEAVSLPRSGLRTSDFARLASAGIGY